MNFVLMDLERTIGSGIVHYWKKNCFGYTTDIREAGRFDEAEAKEIVQSDIQRRTVMISEKDLNQFSYGG